MHGVLLIGLLGLLGIAAKKGFEHVPDGMNTRTAAALGLVAAALLFATLRLTPHDDAVQIGVTGRFVAEALALLALGRMLKRYLAPSEAAEFLWESWKFIRQVFPLLVAGVFAVGVIRGLINPEWVKAAAGANTLTGNLAGVVFGVLIQYHAHRMRVKEHAARMKILDTGMDSRALPGELR